MNESRYSWSRNVTRLEVTCCDHSQEANINDGARVSHGTRKYVMSHTNESCHIRMSHVA